MSQPATKTALAPRPDALESARQSERANYEPAVASAEAIQDAIDHASGGRFGPYRPPRNKTEFPLEGCLNRKGQRHE